MKSMYDAAYPPATPPACDVVAGYLGGDTLHVWTKAEWNSQPARYRLPIWTRSNPGSAAQGAAEGAQAVGRVGLLGMPQGAAIALDYEMAVDDPYLEAFDGVVTHAGYKTLLYGSLSTVEGNVKPSAGFWIAHYTGTPHLEHASTATQYVNDVMLGKPWDLSMVDDTLVLWDTHPSPTPASTPTAPLPEEEDMVTTSNINGRAGLSWAAGNRHVVQVGYDPAGGDPELRVVLVLTTGPWVAPAPWTFTKGLGTGTYPISPEHVPTCRGVILESTTATAHVIYDVTAV